MSSGPDPGDDLALREVVACALAALPPDQRLTLLLIDREGFDYSDVAAIMAVPEGTVCSRLTRARARLRAALTAETVAVVAGRAEEDS